MPVIVDTKSILGLAKKVVNSREFKKKQEEYVRDILLGKVSVSVRNGSVHTAEEAAEKFIEVLKNSISTSGLSANAAAAISDLTFGSPVCVGNKCTIKVSFSGDLHRESLVPNKYPGGIDHLEELLDKGVDHRMRPVHGEWHGQMVWSRTTISGAHFIDAAKRDFMASYGNEYNVTDIIIEYEN